MKCPNCQTPVRPNARFCKVCGYQLQQSVCPRCGSPIRPNARFCGECGFDLTTAPTAAGKQKKALPLWILPALIALIILLAGGAFLYRQRQSRPSAPHATVIARKDAAEVPASPQLATPAQRITPAETPFSAPSFTPTATPTSPATPTPTPLPTPTPTMTPTGLPPGVMKAVFNLDGRFNVRSGPGYNYPIIDIVPQGATFSVIDRAPDPDWLHARDEENQEVWVYAPLLETNYPPQAAAVVPATPIPPTNYLVADSVADFSTKQGEKRWYYLASKAPGSLEFDWMPREGKWYRWTKGGRSPEMRLSAEGSYPSWNSDAIRLWSNFYEGYLRIEGQARKERGAGYGGNGVDLRIVQRRTDENGNDILVKTLWEGALGPYDTQGFTYHVPPFPVKQRDAIYFITSARGEDTLDNTIFTAQIFLMNEGGIEVTPPPTPTPTPRPNPKITCFAPKLRHYERSHGGLGEAVGYVYKKDGRFSGIAIRVEGAPGPDQWRHDFPVSGDGGYEMTALTVYGPPFYYTMRVIGPGIRSAPFKLEYPEGPRRAVVDWYQTPCQ